MFEEFNKMIKFEIANHILIINRNDIVDGVKILRIRSGIPVHSNGIYKLYDNDGVLLYIGMGGNVLSRAISHMKGKSENTKRFYKEIQRAEILILPLYTDYETEELEQYLIKIFKPKYNQRKWSDHLILNKIKNFEI